MRGFLLAIARYVPPGPHPLVGGPAHGVQRLASLDAFRGFAIAGMVLFNAAMFAVAWVMWRKQWFLKV